VSLDDAGTPSESELSPAVDGSSLGAEYRRLMRWYPKPWRVANEDAMLGALLDQAEDQGRDHATERERWALARAGLAQWFILRGRRQRLQIVPLAAGALLSVFYSWFIIWAPGTNYPGSIGPFANPSILTCVLLVLAFAFSLAGRESLARVLSFGGAIGETVIGVVALFHPPFGVAPWEGPSLYTAMLFVGIALVGGASFRHGWALTASALVVAALVAGGLVASFVEAELGYFSIVSTIMSACAAVALCVALGLVVWHTARARRSA
jgi:hypothetical protein